MMRSVLVVLLVVAFCATGCKKPAQTKAKESPAKVEPHPTESGIYHVVLTQKAVERLGITTAEVERRAVPRRRVLAGEVMVPPGQSAFISAPVAGMIQLPTEPAALLPGARVEAGDELFTLIPLLSPERDVPTAAERVQMANAQATLVSAQITADGDLKQAEAEVTAAQIAFDRAQQLQQSGAGSARAADEARGILSVAQKKADAARARKKVLDTLSLEGEDGEATAIPLIAPQAGVVRQLSVVSGQTVVAGASVCEIINLDRMWIRVPIYTGQLESIDREAQATISNLNEQSRESTRAAAPVAAPPTADAISASVDMYYQLDNRDQRLRPGERVSVALPLLGSADNLVVPWASIVIDINGVSWVYEQVEERMFGRRRVLVMYTVDELAVLESGPEVGTEVVVDGVAELFGTEFGTGK